jgi:hypothetical protein
MYSDVTCLKDAVIDEDEGIASMIRNNEVVRFHAKKLPMSVLYKTGVAPCKILLACDMMAFQLEQKIHLREPFVDDLQTLREFRPYILDLVLEAEAPFEVVQSPDGVFLLMP